VWYARTRSISESARSNATAPWCGHAGRSRQHRLGRQRRHPARHLPRPPSRHHVAVNPLGVQQDGVWSDGVAAGAAGGPAPAAVRRDDRLEPRLRLRVPRPRDRPGLRSRGTDPVQESTLSERRSPGLGIQIVRAVQHSGYEETWTPAVRASASFLIQAGRLVGLTALRRGLVLDLTPNSPPRWTALPRRRATTIAARPNSRATCAGA